jgi:hypothetical protein
MGGLLTPAPRRRLRAASSTDFELGSPPPTWRDMVALGWLKFEDNIENHLETDTVQRLHHLLNSFKGVDNGGYYRLGPDDPRYY